jgi:hypothetical protein
MESRCLVGNTRWIESRLHSGGPASCNMAGCLTTTNSAGVHAGRGRVGSSAGRPVEAHLWRSNQLAVSATIMVFVPT